MRTSIYRQYFLILVSVILMTIAWEWGGEGIFSRLITGNDFIVEDSAEKIEYVLTVSTFCLLALILPMLFALKAEQRNNQLKEEREKLIVDLQKSLNEIKVLKGIIPVCSYCKKIRNDEGAWKVMEEYISTHTEASMSHGVCPDCFAKNVDQ